MVHRLHLTHRSLPLGPHAEDPPTKGPPTKVFSRDDFGVDNEGDHEDPSCWRVGEGPPVKEFGRCDASVVTEDVGKGDVIVDTKGVGEAPCGEGVDGAVLV
jgi:hypothetical protein